MTWDDIFSASTWEEWDALYQDSLLKARTLLTGYIEERPTGLPIEKYASSEEEAELRMALSVVILSGRVPWDIRNELAALLVPDDSKLAGDRKLEFKHRRRGRRHDRSRDIEIAGRVFRAVQRGETVSNAVLSVAKEIHMSEENVEGIWKRYGPFFKAGFVE